jgi:hypothetical protein
MPAELITRYRNASADGALVELVVWRVPEPVPPSEHSFKYRLVYVVAGQRVIGFDNERGKGDHLHRGASEFPYRFVSVDQLLDDFFAEVEAWKNAH